MNFDKNDINSFKKVIDAIVDERIKKIGIASFVAAIVTQVNEDNTVNVFIPPDKTKTVNNILNKSGEVLEEGDSVELCTKNGRLSNSWVSLKHGNSNIKPLDIYPVGSIYMSIDSTDPSNYFGGTWERIQGKFLLGANDAIEEYNAGKMGGEATHKLTVNEMPSHNHYPSDKGANWVPNTNLFSRRNIALGSSGLYVPAPDSAGISGWKWGGTSFVGGGQAHNNMPPFLAVYVWKRIS